MVIIRTTLTRKKSVYKQDTSKKWTGFPFTAFAGVSASKMLFVLSGLHPFYVEVRAWDLLSRCMFAQGHFLQMLGNKDASNPGWRWCLVSARLGMHSCVASWEECRLFLPLLETHVNLQVPFLFFATEGLVVFNEALMHPITAWQTA